MKLAVKVLSIASYVKKMINNNNNKNKRLLIDDFIYYIKKFAENMHSGMSIKMSQTKKTAFQIECTAESFDGFKYITI